MEDVIQEINVNVAQPNNLQFITAMQGDYNSMYIKAYIYDKNKPYNISCNSVTVQGATANGAPIANVVDSYTAHDVTFRLTQEMLSCGGAMSLTLVFSGSNKQLSTFPFAIIVTDKPKQEFTPTELDLFQRLVNQASEYAALSKSYAVGTGGQTRKDDDTDNSKYYKEKSAESALASANSANSAKQSATDSAKSATNAQQYATEIQKQINIAKDYATKAQSWAVGGTNTRDDEDTDNGKYYYDAVKKIIDDNGGLGAGNIAYYETYAQFKADFDADKIKPETLVLIKENIDKIYSVTVIPTSHMQWDSTSGKLKQDVVGAMDSVVITTKSDYYYPIDYSADPINDVMITRDSYTQITVSGIPTANTVITLSEATAKETQDVPNVTADYGKIVGTTTAMEYAKTADSTDWNDCTDSETIVPSGTWCVRYKETDTQKPSDSITLTVTKKNQSAPTNLYNAGLKIGGTTSKMEYASSSTSSAWTTCTDGNTVVSEGTWYVRYRETIDSNASDSVSIEITEAVEISNRYLMMGKNGLAKYSLDGSQWIDMTGIDSTASCNKFVYGDGKIVAVGDDGKSYCSVDGTSWNSMSGLRKDCKYTQLVYGNNVFVCAGALNDSSDKGAIMYYSTNGVDWIEANIINSSSSIGYHTGYMALYTENNYSYITQLIYYNDNFYVVLNSYVISTNSNNGIALYKSSNGKDWNIVDTISNSNTYDVYRLFASNNALYALQYNDSGDKKSIDSHYTEDGKTLKNFILDAPRNDSGSVMSFDTSLDNPFVELNNKLYILQPYGDVFVCDINLIKNNHDLIDVTKEKIYRSAGGITEYQSLIQYNDLLYTVNLSNIYGYIYQNGWDNCGKLLPTSSVIEHFICMNGYFYILSRYSYYNDKWHDNNASILYRTTVDSMSTSHKDNTNALMNQCAVFENFTEKQVNMMDYIDTTV